MATQNAVGNRLDSPFSINGTSVTSTGANLNLLSGASQTVVQQAYEIDATLQTGTTIIPMDNTIPQNTEGDEYLSVTITPKSASNILDFDVMVHCCHSAGTAMTAALFQDATANAIVCGTFWLAGANQIGQVKIRHRMAAGTTSATTFKVRVGCTNVGTTTINGSASAAYLNGTMASSLIITEYTP